MGVITAAGYLVGLIERDREACTRIYASSCPRAVCRTCRCSRCGAGSSSPVTWRSRRGSSDDRATAVKHRRLLSVGGGGGGVISHSPAANSADLGAVPAHPHGWRQPVRRAGEPNLAVELSLKQVPGIRPVPAIRRSPSRRLSVANPPSGDAPPSSPLNTSPRAEGGLSGQMPRTRTLAGTRTCC